MSTRRSRWALASICTRVLLGGAVAAALAPSAGAGGKDQAVRAPTLLEVELEEAKKAGVYLVLQPARSTLAVRSRGVTLEEMSLKAVSLLAYRSVRGVEEGQAAEQPVFWTVAEDPEATHRKLIAPTELRPYPDEEAEAEEENAELPVSTAPAVAEPLPTPPAAYRIDLDPGWQLLVAQEVPGTDLWSRLVYAVRDGWSRLLGRPSQTPLLLVLAAEASEAQKMHHFFRSGTRILYDPSGT
jgi:hypothetical protein